MLETDSQHDSYPNALRPTEARPSDPAPVRCSQDSSNSMFSPRRDTSIGSRESQSDDESLPPPLCSQEEVIEVNPGCYHREGTIFDSEAFPFPYTSRYWDENGHLVIDREVVRKLYSQSKMLGCTLKTTKDPVYGVSWSLVFIHSGMGLPESLIKAIYFFHTIELMSQHHTWNGFVTTTNNLHDNLYPKFAPDGKEKSIVGVIRKSSVDKEQTEFSGGSSGVDMRRLLDLGDYASGGLVDRTLPLLEMDVGITGATYISDDEEHKDIFSVLHVRWLLNVNFLALIVVSRARVDPPLAFL